MSLLCLDPCPRELIVGAIVPEGPVLALPVRVWPQCMVSSNVWMSTRHRKHTHTHTLTLRTLPHRGHHDAVCIARLVILCRHVILVRLAL